MYGLFVFAQIIVTGTRIYAEHLVTSLTYLL